MAGDGGPGPGQELSKRMREEEDDKLNMNTPQSPVSQSGPSTPDLGLDLDMCRVQGISCF